MKNKNLIVVGGLIFKSNKILICQRSSDNEHPLKWEFPGGKVKKIYQNKNMKIKVPFDSTINIKKLQKIVKVKF